MSENAEVKIKEQELRLEPDSELRFEVKNKNDTVVLEVITGYAEIFCTELVKGKLYTFYFGAKITVFSFQGCTIKLCRSYVAKETVMPQEKSGKEIAQDPATMIVGPAYLGKSTLCRVLLHYSTRMISSDRRPIYVDLDPDHDKISGPGTIGAVIVERKDSYTPQIYNYGYINMSNSTVYNTLVSRMAEVIHHGKNDNSRVKHSGVIMNAYGLENSKRYQNLTYIALAFDVDVLIVLDQERLYNALFRDMPASISMSYLELLPDLLPDLLFDLLSFNDAQIGKSRKLRLEGRGEAHIRKYFYGTPRSIIHPKTYKIKFSDMKLYRMRELPIPNIIFPLNMQRTDLKKKVEPIAPGLHMLHHVLALKFSTIVNKDISKTSVAGFVCVTNVDISGQMLTLLSPQPIPLPKTIYLMLNVQFIDCNA